MNLFGVIYRMESIVEQLVPLMIGFAVLYFLWGTLKYVQAKDGETQVEARSMITHGIIVLFVMVSVWGLVNLIVVSFGVGPTTLPTQSINIDSGSSSSGTSGGSGSSRRIFCWGRNC